MKRNFELIRQLLLRIEEDEPLDEIPGIDAEARVYHLRLLKQAGLIDAVNMSSLDGEDYHVNGLTWEGHDFLDQARNDSVWNTVRRKLKEQAVTVSMAILKSLLMKEARRQLGLPDE